MIRTLEKALAVFLLAGLSAGCGTAREQFLEGRALDPCDESWPVCAQVVGCVVGNTTYVEGRFPGAARFVVRLAEPSVVRVYVYMEEIGAAGTHAIVDWNEDGCGTRVREEVSGVGFVEEAERVGWFLRSASLTGVGDHLIEVRTDGEARYLVKTEVIPTRLTN